MLTSKRFHFLTTLLGLLLAGGSLLLPPAAAQSAVIYVDAASSCTGSCGGSWADAYPKLQDALAAAGSGDEIWVAAGVYYPDEGEGQVDNDTNATFELGSGVALYGSFAGGESSRDERAWETNVTVLSGDVEQNDVTDASGVVTDTANVIGANSHTVLRSFYTGAGTLLDGFTVTAGENNTAAGGVHLYGSEATLANLTFSGNQGPTGAALLLDDGNHAVTNVTFQGNVAIEASYIAESGGGMAIRGGNTTVVVSDASFINNRSTYRGGAISVEPGATLALSNATIANNRGDFLGGGISNAGVLTLDTVTVRANSAAYSGGGIHHFGEPAFLTAINVAILDNSAGDQGGGLTADDAGATLNNVVIAGNFTVGDEWGIGGDGGGIHNTLLEDAEPHNMTMTNVLISGNRAAKDGGGIFRYGPGAQTLTNVTITGNSAGENGGGLYVLPDLSPALTTFANSIVWNNAAPAGAQFAGDLSVISATYTLVQGDFSGEGNLDVDPLFVEPLDPAQAPTTAGNLVLRAGSPAIDAGNTAGLPADSADLDGDGDTAEPLPYDLTGAPRLHGSAVDVGAHERKASVQAGDELATSETGAGDLITVTLHAEPSSAVTVTLTGSDAAEATVSPAQLTFDAGNWDTPQTAVVAGVDDDVDDGPAAFTVTVTLASPDPTYDAWSWSLLGTNEDDDTAGVTVTPTTGLTTTEAGSSDAFTVVLDSEPTAGVTLLVSGGDNPEAAASPPSLQFSPADWSEPQTVAVAGVDDDVIDGAAAFTMTLTAVSDDAVYAGLSAAAHGVNQDDDVAGLALSPDPATITLTAGQTATFTVALASRPAAPVAVGLSSSQPAVAALQPDVLVFDPAGWNTPQTVTVLGVAEDGGQTPFNIRLAVISTDPDYDGHESGNVEGILVNDYTYYVPFIITGAP